MLDVERALTDKFPVLGRRSRLLTRPLFGLLRRLLHEREINRFLQAHEATLGIDFVDRVLEYFNFSYSVSGQERANIPAEGRVVIIANHPIGSLDGLALLRLVAEIRSDVRVVANDLLWSVPPMRPLLLPINTLSGRPSKSSLIDIERALGDDMAVILFPAGEVSRSRPNGIRDGRWQSGFLKLARKAGAPIVPVFLDGCNSPLFYLASIFFKPLGTLLLVNEMFNKRDKVLPIRVGRPIPQVNIARLNLPTQETVRLIRRHLYQVGRGKPPIIPSETPIAHPESRQALKRELKGAELLGHTSDGMKIYLFDHQPGSSVMRELGRLRELTFRQVGEGVGERRDLDAFDRRYRHLILWDEEELEIAGAYRIGEAGKILRSEGRSGLYCTSLFRFDDTFTPYLEQSIELGRSFVQPRYWGRRSLDYLWYGIGAYLRAYPKIKYMYGPVSLSNRYPPAAHKLLVDFYRRYFPCREPFAVANFPYRPDPGVPTLVEFRGGNYRDEFTQLKETLKHLGLTVPTLYKQYTELCEEGGVRFLDFSIDPSFGFCIDGLVLVEVAKVKARNRQRYIERELRVA